MSLDLGPTLRDGGKAWTNWMPQAGQVNFSKWHILAGWIVYWLGVILLIVKIWG